ncbi:MAG: hypothetical protein ABIP39_15150 [Polyangiaceae bacterium]
MKLARIFALMSVGVAAGGIFLFQGCSSSSTTDSSGSNVGKPPAKPASGTPTASTTEHNFAIYNLLLGDAPRGTGAAQSTTAWKKFGYNIDGKVSTRNSTDVCKVSNSGPKSVHDNGDNGIDNSFGANILPIVLNTAGAEGPSKINQAITDGSFTIMFDVLGLDDSPTQTNTGLTAQVLAGGAFDAVGKTKPTFTMADNWAVRPELLSNKTDPKSSMVKFSDAYVVNGTFVNADQGSANSDITIALSFSGVALSLTIHKAIVTFDHTQAGLADNGTIAGVIGTEELITGLKAVAGRISTSLCTGSAFDGIAGQIKQASDIMQDGTQSADATCDGISIGLGFVAKQIGNPQKVGDLAAPSPDPCSAPADAGAD